MFEYVAVMVHHLQYSPPLLRIRGVRLPWVFIVYISLPLLGGFEKQTAFFSYLCCVSAMLRIVISWYLFSLVGQDCDIVIFIVYLFFFFLPPPPPFPAQFRE